MLRQTGSSSRIQRGGIAPEHFVALVVFTTLVTCSSIGLLIRELGPFDFATFHRSGRAYIEGTSIYMEAVRMNLNPPSLVIFLFAPLSTLSLRPAAVVWSLLGGLAVLASMRVIARELELTSKETVVAACALLALPGSTFVWAAGQVTWLLLYPVTCAWSAYRGGRYLAAGLWLTPLIATKPFFAIALLPLGALVTGGACTGAAAVSLLSVAAAGWEPWAQWIALSNQVRWLAEPGNASLPGAIARFMADAPPDAIGLGDFGMVAWGFWLAAVFGVVVVGFLMRNATPDVKWLAAFLGAIVVAPLGWMYYFPLPAGAAIAHWRRHGAPLVLWAHYAPFVFFQSVSTPQWLYALMASWYSWSLIATWMTIMKEGLANHSAPSE